MIDMKELYGKDELPLQNLSSLVSDGGFTGIFRKIGIVGDSLSSGEFQATGEFGESTYHDCYDYSWGSYLGRMAGVQTEICARGGMTADEFVSSYAVMNNCWERLGTCDAVIIALAVNDANQILRSEIELGKAADLDFTAWRAERSYVSRYAGIITKIKRTNPFCHFFLVTPPVSDSSPVFTAEMEKIFDSMRDELQTLTGMLKRTYLLDLRKYAPVYDREFGDHFFMDGHMNPAGYLFTAKLIASYIDYIVRHSPEKFHQVGFTHSPISNERYEK